jgi:hypothetical protein
MVRVHAGLAHSYHSGYTTYMTRTYRRHTTESLGPIVAESYSCAEVVKKLGLRMTGGNYDHIKGLIAKFELDTTHFDAKRRISEHVSNVRKTPEQIFVVNEPLIKSETHKLRRALIEVGEQYICSECHQRPVHNGKPLVLQVDHINGQYWDNRRENLRFLCPNCHSQTENYGSKNKRHLG